MPHKPLLVHLVYMLVPGIGVAKLDWFPTCPGPYMIVVF